MRTLSVHSPVLPHSLVSCTSSSVQLRSAYASYELNYILFKSCKMEILLRLNIGVCLIQQTPTSILPSFLPTTSSVEFHKYKIEYYSLIQ